MNNKTSNKTEFKGLLGKIEKLGNKMPHPLALFLYLTLAIIAISGICSIFNISAIHPTTGETVEINNLFSTNGLVLMLKDFINNFQTMPILGSTIVFSVVCGICEKTGLFTNAIKMGLKNAKGPLVVFIIAMIGCFSNQAGDVAFIIVPTIAAAIFLGLGRNPIAGIFAGYASVGGGFGTELLPAFLSNILTPVSVQAAQTIQPDFTMSPLSGYFVLLTAAILVSLTVTVITVKIVEPRLGKYNPEYADESINVTEFSEVTTQQKIATKKAGISLIIYLVVLILLCVPSKSFFRSPEGSLLVNSPLMDSVIGLLVLMFFIPGLVYGISSKQIKSIKDYANISIEAVKDVAPFIVLAILIGQFLSLFTISNIGTIIAIKGGSLLQASQLPSFLIVTLFIILVLFVNIFMMSGSTKYLIFGPIFVPMFMQLNIHPALTQIAYRMGDCITNSLTPLNAAFLICITICQKYNKNIGMGNFFSAMFSYSVGFFIILTLMVLVWMIFGLPTGPTGGIWL